MPPTAVPSHISSSNTIWHSFQIGFSLRLDHTYTLFQWHIFKQICLLKPRLGLCSTSWQWQFYFGFCWIIILISVLSGYSLTDHERKWYSLSDSLFSQQFLAQANHGNGFIYISNSVKCFPGNFIYQLPGCTSRRCQTSYTHLVAILFFYNVFRIGRWSHERRSVLFL